MRVHGSEVRGSRDALLSPLHEGRFGRLFRRLQPAPSYGDDQLQQLAEAMREQSSSGGWNASAPIQDGDNPSISAGYTYFGQFLDHDLTFDPVSSFQHQDDPDALRDFRSPRFDLDSLYGSGPADEPFQYESVPTGTSTKLLIETNANGVEDLPRNKQGIALIGDPRNDENVVVSQVQLAFLKLHNKLLTEVEPPTAPLSQDELQRHQFEAAQRLTRWHYQWLVAFDFLPKLVGEETMTKVWPKWKQHMDKPSSPPDIKRRFYKPRNNPYMPVEFSAAAFRFGHSQIRPTYALNDAVPARPIFVPGDAVNPGQDLRGFRPRDADSTIDWSLFFPTKQDRTPQPSRLINTRLSAELFDLPHIGDPDMRMHSLAFRNLKRGQHLALPSGQDVARATGEQPLTGSEIGSTLDPTPLWFYILGEAGKAGEGKHLGPVGGRIVAEVLLGLLEIDTRSFLQAEPTWQPREDRRTVGAVITDAGA
ncbi:heme peroxidase family protein [Micromonospora sp. NPDC048930]|uniref:peroxidase family protein n=1 Tax=Micromonospora sp. NPDC048930 TaxID=3364261 RepID=UPI00371D2E17